MAQALQQIQGLEASTKLLETQCQQLEHERREMEKQLDALRQERLTTTSEHEQALAGLRGQLGSAEEALRAANDDAAERLRVEKVQLAAEAQRAATLRHENDALVERLQQQQKRAAVMGEEAAARSASLEAAVAAAADNIRRAHEVRPLGASIANPCEYERAAVDDGSRAS
jgi:chromosome segregation ATPase